MAKLPAVDFLDLQDQDLVGATNVPTKTIVADDAALAALDLGTLNTGDFVFKQDDDSLRVYDGTNLAIIEDTFVTVDSAIDIMSLNPVENKAIAEALQRRVSGYVVADEAARLAFDLTTVNIGDIFYQTDADKVYIVEINAGTGLNELILINNKITIGPNLSSIDITNSDTGDLIYTEDNGGLYIFDGVPERINRQPMLFVDDASDLTSSFGRQESNVGYFALQEDSGQIWTVEETIPGTFVHRLVSDVEAALTVAASGSTQLKQLGDVVKLGSNMSTPVTNFVTDYFTYTDPVDNVPVGYAVRITTYLDELRFALPSDMRAFVSKGDYYRFNGPGTSFDAAEAFIASVANINLIGNQTEITLVPIEGSIAKITDGNSTWNRVENAGDDEIYILATDVEIASITYALEGIAALNPWLVIESTDEAEYEDTTLPGDPSNPVYYRPATYHQLKPVIDGVAALQNAPSIEIVDDDGGRTALNVGALPDGDFVYQKDTNILWIVEEQSTGLNILVPLNDFGAGITVVADQAAANAFDLPGAEIGDAVFQSDLDILYVVESDPVSGPDAKRLANTRGNVTGATVTVVDDENAFMNEFAALHNEGDLLLRKDTSDLYVIETIGLTNTWVNLTRHTIIVENQTERENVDVYRDALDGSFLFQRDDMSLWIVDGDPGNHTLRQLTDINQITANTNQITTNTNQIATNTANILVLQNTPAGGGGATSLIQLSDVHAVNEDVPVLTAVTGVVTDYISHEGTNYAVNFDDIDQIDFALDSDQRSSISVGDQYAFAPAGDTGTSNVIVGTVTNISFIFGETILGLIPETGFETKLANFTVALRGQERLIQATDIDIFTRTTTSRTGITTEEDLLVVESSDATAYQDATGDTVYRPATVNQLGNYYTRTETDAEIGSNSLNTGQEVVEAINALTVEQINQQRINYVGAATEVVKGDGTFSDYKPRFGIYHDGVQVNEDADSVNYGLNFSTDFVVANDGAVDRINVTADIPTAAEIAGDQTFINTVVTEVTAQVGQQLREDVTPGISYNDSSPRIFGGLYRYEDLWYTYLSDNYFTWRSDQSYAPGSEVVSGSIIWEWEVGATTPIPSDAMGLVPGIDNYDPLDGYGLLEFDPVDTISVGDTTQQNATAAWPAGNPARFVGNQVFTYTPPTAAPAFNTEVVGTLTANEDVARDSNNPIVVNLTVNSHTGLEAGVSVFLRTDGGQLLNEAAVTSTDTVPITLNIPLVQTVPGSFIVTAGQVLELGIRTPPAAGAQNITINSFTWAFRSSEYLPLSNPWTEVEATTPPDISTLDWELVNRPNPNDIFLGTIGGTGINAAGEDYELYIVNGLSYYYFPDIQADKGGTFSTNVDITSDLDTRAFTLIG